MHYTTVIKDAFWQIIGRVVGALSAFFVTVLLTHYLDPLRYGDYVTILNYFALRSALADFGIYTIGLREIGKIKAQYNITDSASFVASDAIVKKSLSIAISEFVRSRLIQIIVVYAIAIGIAYMIPAYSSNIYMVWGLPLGMAFSALFMMAGILQLPLQLFWKMEHISIGLVMSRVVQILFLLLMSIFYGWSGDGYHSSLIVFVLVVLSILFSSLVQVVYTIFMGYKIIPLCKTPFLHHMRNHIKESGTYGVAFFLSSFHLLIVGLLLSILYPTVAKYNYVAIRGLIFQLIQLLFIVPASLANSMIHKINAMDPTQQARGFGQMLLIMVWFGGLCLSNFIVFSPHIVHLVSGSRYLGENGIHRTLDGLRVLFETSTIPSLWGADMLLPFLGLFLALSFVRTVFNYIFVVARRQNLLLPINIIGVGIGLISAIVLVYNYAIWGGVIAQLFMEIVFLGGSLWYAHVYSILPRFSFRKLCNIIGFFVLLSVLGFVFPLVQYTQRLHFVVYFVFYNVVVFSLRYSSLKSLFKFTPSV